MEVLGSLSQITWGRLGPSAFLHHLLELALVNEEDNSKARILPNWLEARVCGWKEMALKKKEEEE